MPRTCRTRTIPYPAAIAFAALTFAVEFLALLPSIGPSRAVLLSAVQIRNCLIGAVVLLILWKLVGVRGHIREFLAVFAYQASLVVLSFNVFAVLGDLTLRLLDPDNDATLSAVPPIPGQPPALASSPTWPVAQAVVEFGSLLSGIWQIFAWGAFRRLFGVGRWRSLLVFMMWIVLIAAALFAFH